jgi:tetratricopeptide (TPR) repeat protein
MSPEQANGRWKEIDERSDVYSLGATLYMILTGSKPFQGGVQTVLEKVRKGEFPTPCKIKRSVPRPLEAVCLRAMRLDGNPIGLMGSDYKNPDLLGAANESIDELSSDPEIQTRLMDAIGDQILKARKPTAGPGDLGVLYTFLGTAQVYAGSKLTDASPTQRALWLSQAAMSFFNAKQAVADADDNHPAKLIHRYFQLNKRKLLSSFITIDQEALFRETIELSKRAFHSKETHPGNLYVRLMLLRSIEDLTVAEPLYRELAELARPVFAGTRRSGHFETRLAEVLRLLGARSQEESVRERYLADSESVLLDQVERYRQSGHGAGRPMAACQIHLAEIERDRGNFEKALEYYETTVDLYDACGAGGYVYMGIRARSGLAETLRKLGRDEEAERVTAVRDALREELQSRVPELANQVFADAPSLALQCLPGVTEELWYDDVLFQWNSNGGISVTPSGHDD